MLHQPWGPSIDPWNNSTKHQNKPGFLVVFGGVDDGRRWHDHVCHIFDRPPEVFLILAAFNFYLDGTRYTWKMWTDVVAVVILATIHLIRAILHPTQILMPLIFALGFFGLWVLLLDLKMVDARVLRVTPVVLKIVLMKAIWSCCAMGMKYYQKLSLLQILVVAPSTLLSWNIQTWHTWWFF